MQTNATTPVIYALGTLTTALSLRGDRHQPRPSSGGCAPPGRKGSDAGKGMV